MASRVSSSHYTVDSASPSTVVTAPAGPQPLGCLVCAGWSTPYNGRSLSSLTWDGATQTALASMNTGGVPYHFGQAWFLIRPVAPGGAHTLAASLDKAGAFAFHTTWIGRCHKTAGTKSQSDAVGHSCPGETFSFTYATPAGIAFSLFTNADRDYSQSGGTVDWSADDSAWGRQWFKYSTSGTHSYSNAGTWRNCVHGALSLEDGGFAGGSVVMVIAERWKQFLRDLRQGLVPPDLLQKRYRELVQI